MHSQVDSTISMLAGLITTFIAFAFDVPAPAIFAAFIGSCFGIAFTESVTYKRALFMLIGGTVAAGLLVSAVVHVLIFVNWLPAEVLNSSPRGLSAALAFVLVKYHKKILRIFDYQLDKFMGKREAP